MKFKKLLIAVIVGLFVTFGVSASVSFAQQGPVRGEVSVGVYENIKSYNQALATTQAGYTNVANQSVAYTAAAAASSAVNASTTMVIVTLSTAGYIALGAAPTATTSSLFLAANVPSMPLKVTGGTTKVSAIRDAADGVMHITELSN